MLKPNMPDKHSLESFKQKLPVSYSVSGLKTISELTCLVDHLYFGVIVNTGIPLSSLVLQTSLKYWYIWTTVLGEMPVVSAAFFTWVSWLHR